MFLHNCTMNEQLTAPTEQKKWLTRGVLGIGLASLFSDWGHEAATAVLPAFLATLGAPPIALGVIEGVSDGLSSFAKLAGGWIADRPAWRRPTGIIGYVATGLSTFGYVFAQSWPFVLLLRGLGWVGRGSRGPSRDALLADCVPLNHHGRAFGFERAMDTIGAVLGPLCAWAFIGMLGIRGVLRWTIVPGLFAAVAFAFLAPRGKEHNDHEPHGILASFRQLPKGYWPYLAGVFAHGIGDFAPTLLILRATQILSPQIGAARAATFSIALYTFHNLVNAAASYVSGVLGDRMRKRALLSAGYVIGAIAYVGFIFLQPTIPILALLFGLAGIHIGVAQSLEKSAASEILPAANRGSGFGLLATVNGVGDLVSSVAVGALWSAIGATAGFLYAAIFGFIGAVLIYRPEQTS